MHLPALRAPSHGDSYGHSPVAVGPETEQGDPKEEGKGHRKNGDEEKVGSAGLITTPPSGCHHLLVALENLAVLDHHVARWVPVRQQIRVSAQVIGSSTESVWATPGEILALIDTANPFLGSPTSDSRGRLMWLKIPGYILHIKQ